MVDVSDNLPSLLSRFQLFAHSGDSRIQYALSFTKGVALKLYEVTFRLVDQSTSHSS